MTDVKHSWYTLHLINPHHLSHLHISWMGFKTWGICPILGTSTPPRAITYICAIVGQNLASNRFCGASYLWYIYPNQYLKLSQEASHDFLQELEIICVRIDKIWINQSHSHINDNDKNEWFHLQVLFQWVGCPRKRVWLESGQRQRTTRYIAPEMLICGCIRWSWWKSPSILLLKREKIELRRWKKLLVNCNKGDSLLKSNGKSGQKIMFNRRISRGCRIKESF